MLTGIIIVAIVGLLGVLSHRRDRFEEKVFKNVPLADWMTILVFPIFLYVGWFIIVKNILSQPMVDILPFDDFDILAITILFLVYGFVGNAIHFTSKILWRYLSDFEDTMVYRVNEMFHNKLSHYLAYLNGLFIVFLLPMLEINHPVAFPLSKSYMRLVVAAGIIFGVSVSKAIFYINEWFGGYNKPLFFLVTALLLILLEMTRVLRLSFSFYPVNLFVVSLFISVVATFMVRQIFIFVRLDRKRRFRFIARFLSM